MKKLITISLLSLAANVSFASYMCPPVEAINKAIQNQKGKDYGDPILVTVTGADGESSWTNEENGFYRLNQGTVYSLKRVVLKHNRISRADCYYSANVFSEVKFSTGGYIDGRSTPFKGSSSNWMKDNEGEVCLQESPALCAFEKV